MPDRPMISVEVPDGDNGTRTVEVQLPDGYLPESQVRENYVAKETVEQRIKDRLARAKSGLADPDALLDDESFLQRVAKDRREKVLGFLGIDSEGRAVEIDRAREAWEREHVQPLRQELEAKDQRLARHRARIRDAEIERAGTKYGVRDDMRDVLPKVLADRLAYDEDSDEWYVASPDGEGFEYTSRSAKDRTSPYKTIEELVEELAHDDARAAWFESKGRAGAGFRSGDRRPGGPITTEEFEKMSSTERRNLYDRDPAQWQEHMDALAERNREAFAGRSR